MPPLTLEDLAAQIIKLTMGINAATYKWLTLVAEFDSRSKWPSQTDASCAAWLQRNCGLGLGAARERLRAAHALKHLPQLSAAMARGALSFSKVRAATRVATRENEDQLLAIALKGTTKDVERAAQQLREKAPELRDKRQVHGTEQKGQQVCSGSVTHTWESKGFLVLTARIPAEPGKRLLHALETAMKENPGATFTARRADALVELGDSFMLKCGRQPSDMPHPQPSVAAEQPPRPTGHIHHIQQRERPAAAA